MDKVKIVTDFILEIRSQDVALLQAVVTVLVGAMLAGLLGAAIASKPTKVEKLFGLLHFLRMGLSCVALVLFILFIFAYNHRQGYRKDFGIKWIGEHISNIQTQNPKELIEQYTMDYYALKKVDSDFFWKFKVYPLVAACFLLVSLFLRLDQIKTESS